MATNRKGPTNAVASEWMEEEIPKSLPIIPLVSSVLFPNGVLAAIVQRLPLSSDRYQVFLQGRQRVELVQMLQTEPYFEGMLREVVPRPTSKNVKTDNLLNKAMSLFEK